MTQNNFRNSIFSEASEMCTAKKSTGLKAEVRVKTRWLNVLFPEHQGMKMTAIDGRTKKVGDKAGQPQLHLIFHFSL